MKEIFSTLGAAYLLVMNLIGFLQMGIDKRRARRGRYRISERALIATAYLGAGIGSFLGMYFFHHKTKHIKFRIALPVAAILTSILAIMLFMR